MKTLALDAVVLYDDTGAPHNLSRVAFAIDFTETGPSSQNLGVADFDQVNLVLGTESLDELNVFGLCAGLDENTQVCLTLVKSLGAFTETTSETIMNECVLQNLLECDHEKRIQMIWKPGKTYLKSFLDGQFSLGCRFGSNLNLGCFNSRNVISSVRHPEPKR